MKLTIILCMVGVLQVAARSAAQTVSYSARESTLQQVFDVIRQQTGYTFFYNEEHLKGIRPVTVHFMATPMEEALAAVLKGHSLSYSIKGKMVVIKKDERKANRVTIDADLLFLPVTGVVRDVDGKPLVGATIRVKGKAISTVTDEGGGFGLTANVGDVLVISYVGFSSKDIIVSDESPILINLMEAVRDMDTTVITLNAGYYTVKDKQRTGSISKVTAKEIGNQPVTNLLSAIQGRMAGVNITQYSGIPGGGYDIQIRGRNSLRVLGGGVVNSDGNQPLYLIDGVPISEMESETNVSLYPIRRISPLNSIDINTIESIEILKDADATAIYGSRGANGVVLITTKKGKAGKVSVSLNSSFALSKAHSRLKMMNLEQYLDMRKQAYANSGFTQYPADAYDINGTWDPKRSTDWTKELIGNTATAMNTQVSLTGGSETTSFLLTIGHNEQSTVFSKDFKYKTNTIASNIAHRSVNNRFRLNISNTFSLLKNNVISSDITRQAHRMVPNSPSLYKVDGSLNWENNTFTNPIAAYQSTYSSDNKQYLSNINMEYELFSKFFLKLSGGMNYQTLEEWRIIPNTIYNPAYVTGQSSAYSNTFRNNQNRLAVIAEPQVRWSYQKGNHLVDILAGGTLQQETNQKGSLAGTGFQSNVFIRNIGAATTKIISEQVQTEYMYVAAFSRLNYQFNKRYILNITGRRDGSSRFGPNKKFANFGAVGAAWLFSDEIWLKHINWLSLGKLRSSYGSAGSDNIGDYQYLDTYTISSKTYDGVTSLLPTKLFNGDYSWEKTVKWDMALELGFLDNKINASLNWYRNRSSSQLVGYQLSAVTGFESVQANLPATIENRGIEIELSARPLSSSVIQWKTGINLSIPKSKLISFPGLEGSPYASAYIVGYPTTILKLYQLEGIDPATGLYKFTDFNHDGKISSPNDNKVIENIGVRFFGGWENTFQYKNWDLAFLFQFVKQRSRNYNNILTTPGQIGNQPIEVLDVWSPDNPDGLYSPYKSAFMPQQDFFQRSDVTVSDGSYIRMKNIQISYRLPVKNGIFRNFKVYFQGQNLFTWTNYFGVDPEFLASAYLPPLKTYSFGLQIIF